MIKVDRSLCDLCGTCVGVCPSDCINLDEHILSVDNEECIKCQKCVIICPVRALKYEE